MSQNDEILERLPEMGAMRDTLLEWLNEKNIHPLDYGYMEFDLFFQKVVETNGYHDLFDIGYIPHFMYMRLYDEAHYLLTQIFYNKISRG